MMNVIHLWYNSVITLFTKTLQEEDLLFPPELNVQMKLYFTLSTSLILVIIYFIKFLQYSFWFYMFSSACYL